MFPLSHHPSPPAVCFVTGVRRDLSVTPVRHHLSDDWAQATSNLLQVLCCGEESAVFAFHRLAGDSRLQVTAQEVLGRIADEESYHEVMLANLRASLPEAPQDAGLAHQMLRFFRSLGTRELGVHFARLAALDSGVCLILSQLRRPAGAFQGETEILRILARIHREESTHVASSLAFARELLPASRLREVMTETRQQLSEILMMRAGALETLGVGPEKLHRRLSRVPQSRLL